MKELKELGFEYLPTLNEFRKRISLYSMEGYHSLDRLNSINQYGDFINQQPKLGDFIPCINGVPVDRPKMKTKLVGFNELEDYYDQFEYEHYQQALERVKFEGWAIYHRNKYSTLIINKSQMLNMVADGTLHGELYEDIYKTYEHAINEGVKFKIK